MAFYRRGYYRRGRSGYGYRGYNRSWRRRGWYRSSRGSSVTRSQQSGRRYFNISFPIENIVTLTINANQSFSNVLRTSPYYAPSGTADTDAARALNCCGLPASLAFRKYCQLYDQVKVNSVSFYVAIAAAIGAGGVTPGLRAYTSWDRNYVFNEDLVTADNLINGPESQAVTFINNSRCKFSRYNSASDLQERTTFIDSTLANSSNSYWANKQWVRGSGSNMVGYCPSMSLVLQTSDTQAATRTITLQVQARYNVTFRNPKFGLSVEGNAKGVDSDVKVEPVKSEGAGKSVSKSVTFDAGAVSEVLPLYTGLLGDVVDRLSANSDEEGVYGDGEYNRDEDIEFAYRKLGDEKFHEVFKEVYDVSLKELGLISDSKSTVSKEA